MHPAKIHVKDMNKLNYTYYNDIQNTYLYLDFIFVDILNKISLCIKITFFPLLIQIKGIDLNPIINKVLVTLLKKISHHSLSFPLIQQLMNLEIILTSKKFLLSAKKLSKLWHAQWTRITWRPGDHDIYRLKNQQTHFSKRRTDVKRKK